jgi:hypothetical protein
MNPLYWLLFFGVAFFGFMVVVGVVQARRKKEKAYYIGTVVSFFMLLWFISIIVNQLVFALAFFVAWVTLAIVGLPKMMKTMKREPLKELQETDFSAQLRVRDLLTWKGWFMLKSRWGIRKTMCLYSLLNMGGIGAIVFTLSILGLISMVLTAVVTILVGIFSPIFFYYQIGKALEQTEEKHR